MNFHKWQSIKYKSEQSRKNKNRKKRDSNQFFNEQMKGKEERENCKNEA